MRTRIAYAAKAAGRSPSDVTLLPVTKYFPATDVHILYRLGCVDFGESKVQEASAKIADFAALAPDARDVSWHMIGRLQRNKANHVARWAAWVHSIDSERLAVALSRGVEAAMHAHERSTRIKVCIQVSLDGDPSRGGVQPMDVHGLADVIATLPGLELAGLMAVPPIAADPEQAFADLQRLHERFVIAFPSATTLSSGMSGDAESAIQHGSTCVRVGTALLGLRPITSP
ncbi:YggS family pyridoxal phosphate-dependent enzyme [Hoyosella rhizosphaerae]|nr:YggS family pyridoxal phosphate-dependent enzyme [Hoyosella rhizosphaerae]